MRSVFASHLAGLNAQSRLQAGAPNGGSFGAVSGCAYSLPEGGIILTNRAGSLL